MAIVLNKAAGANEARNAAVAAFQIIEKYKLLVSEAPVHVRPVPPRPSTPRRGRATFMHFEGGLDEFQELFSAIFPTQEQTTRVREHERPPPPQPRVPDSSVRRPPDTEAQLTAITEPAWCAGCGQRLKLRAVATWSRGEVWHPACFRKATE
jgi:hypothetical protein